MPRHLRSIPLVAALTVLFAGCTGRTTAPAMTPSDPAPVASSATAAVSLLGWCWRYRDIDRYPGVFADDLVGFAAAGDSVGGIAPESWAREQELVATSRIFVGDAIHPHVSKLTSSFDVSSGELAESLPAHSNRWHRTLIVPVDIRATLDLSSGFRRTYHVAEVFRFHLVRGDSAVIPVDLAMQGVRSDSTRWYLWRWEDLTLSPPATSSDGSVPTTWRALKQLFL